MTAIGSRVGVLRRVAAGAMVLGISLAACGGSASQAPSQSAGSESQTPSMVPTAVPTAATPPSATAGATANPADFSNAATALANLDSYKFDVEIQSSSAGTAGTQAGSTSFTGTVVNKPDKAQTLDMVQKDATGTVTDATSYIVMTGAAWVKSGASGTWQQIPAAQADLFMGTLTAFRPEQLFSLYFLPGATDNTAVGTEQKNGVATTHYKGGDAIGAILSAIAGVSGQWSSDVWIANDGGYLVHSEASVAAATSSSGGSFSIVVDITDINASGNAVSAP